VVHDAVQTLSASARRTAPTAAILICFVALVAGCGGSSHSSSTRGGASQAPLTSLRLSNCTDWNHASQAQRKLIVTDLRRFAGGPVGSSAGIQQGPVLEDARAYRLLQSYCAQPFARGFKLYKLYTRAAAFVGR
jgi:hypothetical protein